MRTTKTPILASFVGLCLALGCGSESESDTDPTNADDDDDSDDDNNDDDNDDNNDDSVSVSGSDSSSAGSVDTTDTDATSTATGDTGDTGDTTAASVDDTTGDPTGDTESSTGEQPGDTIYEIQDGTIAIDTPVDVQGVVVTGISTTGLFVQEPGGGEYSGVFVFPGDMGPDISGAALGDVVDIGGVTDEFNDFTEINISAGTFVIVESGPELAAEVVDIATLADEIDGEPWESVLVRVEGDLSVTAVNVDFDEFTVVDGDAIIVDNFIYNVPDSGDFPGLGVTATFTAIQGPLNFFFDFKIAPRSATDLEGYQAPL